VSREVGLGALSFCYGIESVGVFRNGDGEGWSIILSGGLGIDLVSGRNASASGRDTGRNGLEKCSNHGAPVGLSLFS
jgi:hypothetical protein